MALPHLLKKNLVCINLNWHDIYSISPSSLKEIIISLYSLSSIQFELQITFNSEIIFLHVTAIFSQVANITGSREATKM
jgi:hypothetical protein